MQLITTLHKEGFINKLMYVSLLVNVMDVKAIIDTWVTHNYLASMKATRLGLNLEEDVTRIKRLNGNDQRMDGIASNINLKVGDWKGYYSMLMVPLEDFNMILSMDFFFQTEVVLFPYLGGLVFVKES